MVTTILGNEKAYSYQEVNLMAPDNNGMYRYRVILVNRGDRLAEYRERMGKAEQFKNTRQLNIPSLFEHTVDELRDLADDLRQDNNLQDTMDIVELVEKNS